VKINDQISELLFHYDCVIIPEFGGFVTNYKPASLDERLHLFSPPSKEISFNKNLVRNDGLLANFLADSGKITFEEANGIIRKSVEEYFTNLNNGQRITFNKVGIIYRDSAKNLQFEPLEEVNFLKDSFGLEQLFAMPLASPQPQLAPQNEPVIIHLEPEMQQPKVVAIKNNRGKWAWAAVIILPVLAYSGWLLTNADLSRPANLTIADFNPFGKSPAAVYEARKASFVFEAEKLEHDILPESTDADVALVSFTDESEGVWVRLREEVTIPVALTTYVATPEILSMRFHIVGGCFAELANAHKLVDELRAKGYPAYILDQRKGLHRVTFGNFEKRSQAIEALDKIKSNEIAGAWLLVQ
jgi:hypothetical protein